MSLYVLDQEFSINPKRWLAFGFLKHQQYHNQMKLGKFSKKMAKPTNHRLAGSCSWVIWVCRPAWKNFSFYHKGFVREKKNGEAIYWERGTREGAKNNHSTIVWWFQPQVKDMKKSSPRVGDEHKKDVWNHKPQILTCQTTNCFLNFLT